MAGHRTKWRSWQAAVENESFAPSVAPIAAGLAQLAKRHLGVVHKLLLDGLPQGFAF
jgi:hypothetical protein